MHDQYLELIGTPVSPLVRKVLLGMKVKGIRLDAIDPIVPLGEPERIKRLNPLGKIPILKYGEFAVADSAVILQFLDDEFGGVHLYPASSKEKAECRWLEEYSGAVIVGQIASPLFNEKVIKPFVLKTEPVPDKIAEIENDLAPKIFSYLEEQLGKGCLSQNQSSEVSMNAADISVSMALFHLELSGMNIDVTKWPKLANYYSNIMNNPHCTAIKTFAENMMKAGPDEQQNLISEYISE